MTKQVTKRIFDCFIALIVMIVLLPLLLAITLLLLAAQGRPLIYREPRLGRLGNPFTMYKFRTMIPDANHYASVATSDDSRLTPIGGLLKLSRLDELPQLLNVLAGDMSFVGPRPLSEHHASVLDADTVDRLQRVRPGMTGPATILFLAEDQVLTEMHDPESIYLERILPAKARAQLAYVDRSGPIEDMKIILQTAANVWDPVAWKASREFIRSLCQ